MKRSIVVLMLAGCAPGYGDVTGRVLFEGKPLPAGKVTFLGEDGRVAVSQVHGDGSYAILGAPACQVTVLVDSKPPTPVGISRQKGPQPPTPPPAKHVPIPERYADPERSGLSYEIRR